jgi:hypothetical protein
VNVPSVSPVVLTFSCGWCSADDVVSSPAYVTCGTAYGAVADDGHTHAADISHAFRHGGWCTVCGGTDDVHADGCAGDPPSHVNYPHPAGYLYDCPGCEDGPCVCADDPTAAPCLSSSCERPADD